MKRILIWDIPTRLFHWFLAIGVVVAFSIAQFGGEHGSFFAYHAMVGLLVGLMVVLRISWGVFGSRYARFGSFLFGPVAVIDYLKGVASGKGKRHIGHNPASSYAIFSILALVLLMGGSGWMMSRGGEAFEEIHSIAAYILIGIAVLHVIGVIIHTIRHRENITASMITGKKDGEPNDAIRTASPIAGAIAVAVVALTALSLYRNYDPATRQTKLPLIGTAIQLGEAENESGAGGMERGDDHDD